jgi:glutamyl-tRNA reductase
MPDGSVQVLLVGTNHRHAPIGVREELAARAHGDMLVSAVMQEPAVAEAVGLSTCNRCELYMVGEDVGELREAAVRHLAGYAGGRVESLEPLLYVKEGADAAEHLFSVAAGLDSMVPGEAQILSQLRGAYMRALEGGSTGAVSNRLFHEAIEAGKRVRHETAFGSSNASVASVAAELVREKLGALGDVPVLVVGAGKVAELVVTNLVARGADRIVVANRSPERAAELAARFDGASVSLEQLPEAIADAGVVICSTLSERPLITPALVAGGRSRVFVDLAMPRDVDPAVGELTGQTLVNVDDLEQTVRQNIEVRQGEADQARSIVAEQVAEFRGWLAALEVVPAIMSLRALAEQIRTAELERNDGRWEGMTEHDRERLDQLTRSMLNKLLHRPTVRLKEMAADGDPNGHAEAVSELFGLERI